MLIFVYGSLMQGEKQDVSRWFNLPFLGEDEINGDLYPIGWFPGVKLPNDDRIVLWNKDLPSVHGEVFELPEFKEQQILYQLDLYEGAPELFRRRKVQTKNARLVTMYEFCREPATGPIMSGSWRQHTGNLPAIPA